MFSIVSIIANRLSIGVSATARFEQPTVMPPLRLASSRHESVSSTTSYFVPVCRVCGLILPMRIRSGNAAPSPCQPAVNLE